MKKGSKRRDDNHKFVERNDGDDDDEGKSIYFTSLGSTTKAIATMITDGKSPSVDA